MWNNKYEWSFYITKKDKSPFNHLELVCLEDLINTDFIESFWQRFWRYSWLKVEWTPEYCCKLVWDRSEKVTEMKRNLQIIINEMVERFWDIFSINGLMKVHYIDYNDYSLIYVDNNVIKEEYIDTNEMVNNYIEDFLEKLEHKKRKT